ncbi:ABC transporter substrate-binding protein [Oceaniglobus trochenteri]|uniref:ABC transporter substrate-binding protein n=1 Tax=Oceaniglobus trochenteri TaxID=2763260 RepID=UPI001CFFAEAF|nr:ABC transporter substrate-binding protein [Oceaniglobus trochenteri]
MNSRLASLLTAQTVSAFAVAAILAMPSAAVAFTEAPELGEAVASGALPPVDDRLPETPLTVEVVDSIGQYGGTWRNAILAGDSHQWVYRNLGYEQLVRWSNDFTKVEPNIAESFEANEDATEFTFHLRKGMRWSDGAPFTSADIRFWFDDIVSNADVTPTFPAWLMVNGERVTVETPDEHTVIFRFANPNGLFMAQMAGQNGLGVAMAPRHYLEKFHIKYNPDGMDALVAESGANSWVTMFTVTAGIGDGSPSTGNDMFFDEERPVLFAWKPENSLGSGERFTLERNPYYWKVDAEGQQLPYIDDVVYNVVGDAEVMLLQALNGEIDLMSRWINELSNKPVLAENRERGDYRFFTLGETGQNYFVLSLNLTSENPVLNEVFNNKDFRIGLSHALNRQEIINLVFLGQGTPSQIAPRPNSTFYDEEHSTQYTQYDVDLANKHLDDAGYADRDADGFRLGPDGKRISFIVEAYSFMGQWADALELIEKYWKAVGIDMQYRTVDGGLLDERMRGNQHDANLWWSGAGLQDILLENFNHVPKEWSSTWAVGWGNYIQGAPGGVKPPQAALDQVALMEELRAEADPDEQNRLMREVLRISKEQFYNMGISVSADEYGIVSNRFQNVPDYIVGVPAIGPGQVASSQFWIDESK